ncbi:MAG: hypothetical protein K1Y02_16550 [Candidatus Hydrogenedentes bacterium]|nr:hypothetical protein [Candidatus Hydrogenedentota bacterium]
MTKANHSDRDKEPMLYEYSGYLKTILKAPDPAVRDSLDHIEFSGDDLAHWTTRDIASDREWKRIPVHRARTDEGVRLVGRFEDVRKMDTIPSDEPSFWVPLGSLGWSDSRLPIDTTRLPVAEITYRCTSENAHPSWVWTYPGGIHIDALPRSPQWKTLAMLIPHGGFPAVLEQVILRLYSTTRTTESFEIASVRFRALSKAEQKAYKKDQEVLGAEATPKHYPVLDSFLPLGVCLNMDTVRRNAELLSISLSEYWSLTLEDVVTHHHNTLLIESIAGVTPHEWRELMNYAEQFGVKLVLVYDFPLGDDVLLLQDAVDTLIKPFANSPAILSWMLRREPPEDDFQHMLRAKALVEKADPNHPVSIITRQPSNFPLYAPHFSAAGISNFSSHTPWEIGHIVGTHYALCPGQQFWMMGPSFIYATDTPEWSTCPELRLMINLAFAHGARGWFNYTYHNDPIWILGSIQRSLTGPFLTFSDLWLELDRNMERLNALAPMLLAAKPAPMPKDWYAASVPSQDYVQLPEGVDPASYFRLKGADFNLYFVVSNDVRGMSGLHIDVPEHALRGREIFDITDFLANRTWEAMYRRRHLEMFPGQARALLVAEPKSARFWRDRMAERLIEDDRRQLFFNLSLARTYSLNIEPIEYLSENLSEDPMHALAAMDKARDMLIDLVYTTSAIRDTRSKIIEASAGICGCDGVLCRLISRGKVDLAKEWGIKVIPLARELTHIRLELRRGRGQEVLRICEDLTTRVLHLLAEIRALA